MRYELDLLIGTRMTEVNKMRSLYLSNLQFGWETGYAR